MDRQRMVAALMLSATALFLISQRTPSRYRRAVRIAAIVVYAAAIAAVLVWVGLWAAGADEP
jgi:hypothetical protein